MTTGPANYFDGMTSARHRVSVEATELFTAVFAVVLYVVMMLGYSTIYQGTVKLAIWRGGVDSAALEGASALDAVKADGTPSSAVGEGLADALNVGGF